MLQERRKLRGGQKRGQGELVSVQVGGAGKSCLDVSLRWALLEPARLTLGRGASLVTAKRVLSSGGHGGGDATMVLDVFNNHGSAAVSVLVLDRLPWFARVLTHTLKVKARSSKGEVSAGSLLDLKDAAVSLAPALGEGMTMLEYSLEVPPKSSARVAYDIRRAFLHLDHFPPGAPPSPACAPAAR